MVEAVQSGCSQMMKLKVRDTATHSRIEKTRVYEHTCSVGKQGNEEPSKYARNA